MIAKDDKKSLSHAVSTITRKSSSSKTLGGRRKMNTIITKKTSMTTTVKAISERDWTTDSKIKFLQFKEHAGFKGKRKECYEALFVDDDEDRKTKRLKVFCENTFEDSAGILDWMELENMIV